ISKYKLQMRAEYDMDGLMLTELLEIEFTRVPGNPYNITPPAKAPPARIILQKSASLNASDPSNPKKEGTKQKIFQVNLTAGKQYVIEMNQPPGSKVDPYLRLEDLKGKILAEDDDSGG